MKKSIFIALFCAGAISAFAGEPVGNDANNGKDAKKVIKKASTVEGDANGDGIVTIADYVMTMEYTVNGVNDDKFIEDNVSSLGKNKKKRGAAILEKILNNK